MDTSRDDHVLQTLDELLAQNRLLLDALQKHGIAPSSPANPPQPILETQSDFRDYLACERGRKPSTANDYWRDTRRFASYVAGLKNRPALTSDLTVELFCGFIGSLRKVHNTESTVARTAHGLRAYWCYLHRRKLADRAPSLQELDLEFKRHPRYQRVLNKQEFFKLCELNTTLSRQIS